MVVPKLIHPLPPPLQSPETSPERIIDDTWMQVENPLNLNVQEAKYWRIMDFVEQQSLFLFFQELNIQRPPTPTRGRPQPDLDRSSLAYI